jgi:GMP synthase (glutamine-hydrolysing)
MVTATIMSKALKPTQWKAVYIDFGTMRYNETEDVWTCCKELGIPLQLIDLSQECFQSLEGVVDPEQKRKIMGKLFVDAFKNARKQFNPTILAQGTIYPDVIESSHHKGQSDVIKSHHNVGGLPEDLNLKLLEPLRWFFKDEVRMLGKELGLPDKIINRHPFPGPGLSIRIIGEVTVEKIETVRNADRIFMEHINRAGLYLNISQACAGMLEGKSVGVVGDQRRHGSIIVLRAVCTDDFMTATVYPFDAKWLETVATDIINNCSSVARVVYDITSKPPGTIELE